MRRLIESTFVTLDGVISEPQNWSPPYWDEEHSAYGDRLLDAADALLLGRETYEIFAGSWPGRAGDYADRINALPKHVASTTLKEAKWNSTVIEGDVAATVDELKQRDGKDILKFGTGQLDHALIDHALIDELHLWVFPVIAGVGDRLLDGYAATHLKLVEQTPFESGVVVRTYTIPSG